MTEPTDAEIVALADETRTGEPGREGYILPISFARAVLAKFGSPQQEPSNFGAPVPPPPAQVADSVLEDAARYRWLRERSSTMFVNISINGEGAEIAATLDSAVDAARKQGGA